MKREQMKMIPETEKETSYIKIPIYEGYQTRVEKVNIKRKSK